MTDYKMCPNEEMAIYILEFIKRGYEKNHQDAGVRKYTEALQMGIDALGTSEEWVDVNDRLPDEEGDYLVFIVDDEGETRMEVMKLFEWRNCFNWAEYMSSYWTDYNTITHWKPLPKPPKERGDK